MKCGIWYLNPKPYTPPPTPPPPHSLLPLLPLHPSCMCRINIMSMRQAQSIWIRHTYKTEPQHLLMCCGNLFFFILTIFIVLTRISHNTQHTRTTHTKHTQHTYQHTQDYASPTEEAFAPSSHGSLLAPVFQSFDGLQVECWVEANPHNIQLKA